MKKWKEKITLETIIIYSFISFFIISILVFVAGFLFSFQIDNNMNILQPKVKMSISGVLFGDKLSSFPSVTTSTINTSNLFTLQRTVANNTNFHQIYVMATCSVAGFSLIMISIGTFVLFTIYASVSEALIPWMQNKMQNKKQ